MNITIYILGINHAHAAFPGGLFNLTQPYGASEIDVCWGGHQMLPHKIHRGCGNLGFPWDIWKSDKNPSNVPKTYDNHK